MKLENAKYIIAQTNTLLIAEQRPGSAYLAPRAVWRRLSRQLKPGAMPIYVLKILHGNRRRSISLGTDRYDAPISIRSLAVFELDQTTGPDFPTLHTCERKENFADEHSVTLIHASGALAIFGS